MTSWVVVAILVMLSGAAIGGSYFAVESRAPKSVTGMTRGDPKPDFSAQRSLSLAELLTIAIGSNEAVVANIDALNAAAIGILALPVALLVFAVDKIDLHSALGLLAFILTGLSSVAGAVSYEFGYFFWNRRTQAERESDTPKQIQDALDPRRFVTLYGLLGDSAVVIQVDQTINASTRNASIRRWKRFWARVSLVLFIAAAVAIASGRSLRASTESMIKPCTVTVSTPVRARIVVQCP